MSSFQPPTRELLSFRFFKNDPANKLLLKWRIQKFLLLIYLLSKKLTLKFFCSKLKVHLICSSTLVILQENPGGVDLYYAMHLLSSEDIPSLPPGGGLQAK